MILKPWFDLLDIGCKAINMDYKGMKMCELGDQTMRWSGHISGKGYFTSKGVSQHVSIDLNGRHGALRLDLSKPIDKWNNYFDMVTNFGTIEHVENGIYEAFQNIHNFCKVGGVFIHMGPLIGFWPGHSPYHYHEDFFKKLMAVAKYRCIMEEVRMIVELGNENKGCVCAVMVKEDDSPFISKEDFLKIGSIGVKK